ncbi:MAG: DUF1549 domain-containing protein [Isosphaeraceae bacterium]|nr:DUF1549 domain-containing protein [Isosphaeraceae bacterium]
MPARYLASLAFLVAALDPTAARAAAPALSRIEPPGAAAGSSIDAKFIGTFKTTPFRVAVEGAGVTIEPRGAKGEARITVAPDALPGSRWVRVYDEDGASEPRPFIVGSLPERTENEPNDEVAKADPIDRLPALVNGKLEKSGDVDVFAVRVEPGRTLVASIDAYSHLGSPLDAVLQIVSPEGFVLAQNDDHGGFDPLVVLEPKTSGTFLVRIFGFPSTADSSIRFAGGESMLYRLTVTDGPCLDQAIPARITPDFAPVELLGWNLTTESRRIVPRTDPTDEGFAIVAHPSAARVIRVPRDAARVVDESAASQPLPVPSSLTGRIATPGEVDRFTMRLIKNDRVRVRVSAHRFGSPVDPTLVIRDPDGKVVADVDDSDRNDRDLETVVTAGRDGDFRLEIADLHRRSGPRSLYLVDLERIDPDFSVKLGAHQVVAEAGKPAKLALEIDRRDGFEGDLEIRAVGLPESITAPTVKSAGKGPNSKKVELVFESKLPSSTTVRVEARDAKGRTRRASTKIGTIDRPLYDAFLTFKPTPPAPKTDPKPKDESKPKSTATTPAPADLGASRIGVASTHWSFRPLGRPTPPVAKGRAPGHPIDAFLDAERDPAAGPVAADADRRTLIRRLFFDIIGLPPSTDEITAFLVDTAPDAYERLVDRLLARPEYGERWARHWLDVVRYAETNGYERDGAKPGAWKYRDRVIDVLNRDMPFDQFVVEQIAGDELEDARPETRISTTFLRLGTWDDEPADPLVDRYDQLDDVVGTTATAFLGITLRCARCHDHKFEPFSQAEYYRMLAVFEPLVRPQTDRIEHQWFVCSPDEWNTYRSEVVRAAGNSGAFGSGASASLPLIPPPPDSAYIWREDGGTPAPTRIFRRGDPTQPLETVEPGVPAALGLSIPERRSMPSRSSGRRLRLARWIADAANPLTPRVIVNRLWQWHFGTGLVATSNDLGVMGDAPTHPELLDWLAREYLERGRGWKAIHRLIVTSSAYRRLGSTADDGALAAFPIRKLEAEAVRDAMLAVTGELRFRRPGPSVYPEMPRAVLEGQSRPGEGWGRSTPADAALRSIYIFSKRSITLPELDTFDTTSSCERRPRSVTAPGALTFLNGEFITARAKAFADRLRREIPGGSPSERVARAFELALGRPPTPHETTESVRFLERQARLIAAESRRDDAGEAALASFCLVLFNLNDFVMMR